MAPINVALLGYGLAGKVFHGPLVAHEPGLNLHSVVTSRADEVRADHPGARVLSSVAEAIADPEVGLVVVATPDALHAAHAALALNAGKAVVIDKPFASSLSEAQGLVDLARSRGLMLTVFQNRRWDADFLALKAVIASGRLGRIVTVETRYDRFRPAVTDLWKDARDGGVWRDLGPHLVDQMVQLFGPPLGVTADIAVQRDGGRMPDWVQAVLRYEDLRVVVHAGMLVAAHQPRFAVHGTKASWLKTGLDVQESQLKAGMGVGAPGWAVDAAPGVIVDGETGARETPTAPTGGYPAYYAAVARALRGVGDPPVDLDEALSVIRILDAGVESARTRAEVALV